MSKEMSDMGGPKMPENLEKEVTEELLLSLPEGTLVRIKKSSYDDPNFNIWGKLVFLSNAEFVYEDKTPVSKEDANDPYDFPYGIATEHGTCYQFPASAYEIKGN